MVIRARGDTQRTEDISKYIEELCSKKQKAAAARDVRK